MHGDRETVVPHVVRGGSSRRKVLAALLGSIVGLIGQHKDNPTLEELLSPTRPIDRLAD